MRSVAYERRKVFGKKALKKLLRIEEEAGTPCYVFGVEANQKAIVPARILENVADGIRLTCRWSDNTEHSWIEVQNAYVSAPDGKPIFFWNVGNIFGAGIENFGVGSEYLHAILESNIGGGLARTLKELQLEAEKSLPWKTYIIWGAIAIGLIMLWQSGFIQNILPDNLGFG